MTVTLRAVATTGPPVVPETFVGWNPQTGVRLRAIRGTQLMFPSKPART